MNLECQIIWADTYRLKQLEWKTEKETNHEYCNPINIREPLISRDSQVP